MQAVKPGGTLRLNVPNLAAFKLGESVCSPWHSIANLEWTLEAKPKLYDNVKKLAIYVHCCSPAAQDSEDWRCEAKVVSQLLPQKAGVPPFYAERADMFDNHAPNWGYAVMAWDDILNPEKGYIREDGGIVVKATISVTKVFIREPTSDFSIPQPSICEDALVIGEQRLYVSKQYLAIVSPVFKTMFFGDSAEKNNEEVLLMDVNRDEFVELLNVLWPPRKPITVDNVESLLRLGHLYDIRSVMRECEQLLCGDDGCAIRLEKKLLWADRYKLASLQFVCLNSITTLRDAQALESTGEFGDFSPEVKEALLDRILMLI